MNHLQFVTVGFADLLASLPTIMCDWCHEAITGEITERGDHRFCNDYCYADWAVDARAEDAVRYDDEAR